MTTSNLPMQRRILALLEQLPEKISVNLTVLAKQLRIPLETLYIELLVMQRNGQLGTLRVEEMLLLQANPRVFIGHGRSGAWKDLAIFLVKQGLQPDEFEWVASEYAGRPILDVLKDKLESAAVAFIIMTAEDEQADGKWHPRLNVVHELGLFQGRLGFDRAVVLLEDGCDTFSNIHGLHHVGFTTGNLLGNTEAVRGVLVRAGLL